MADKVMLYGFLKFLESQGGHFETPDGKRLTAEEIVSKKTKKKAKRTGTPNSHPQTLNG